MTIRDIANLAGVSMATVSRVLNHTGYVSEETRKKIEDIISEHNYRPNAVARSLIRKNTEMVAVIMPDRKNLFFARLQEAIDKRAEQEGHSVLHYRTAEDPEKEYQAIVQALEHQVQGILLLPVMEPKESTVQLLKEAEYGGTAVVLLDRDALHSSFNMVTIDNSRLVYEGVSLFWKKGHRDIGIIACPEVAEPGRYRLDGYKRALQDCGGMTDEQYIYRGQFDEQSGYKACEYFFGLDHPPTAVLATYSSATLGCIRYLNEHHLTAGEDLGLIGFDDIGLLNAIGYRLTVMNRPDQEMADTAYDMLCGQIRTVSKKKIWKKIFVEEEIIIRGSEGYKK